MSIVALIVGLLGTLAISAFALGGDDPVFDGNDDVDAADEGQSLERLPDNVTDTYRSLPEDGDAFNVDVAFVGDGWTDQAKAGIADAADTISEIILADTPAAEASGYGVVDDQLIVASIGSLDGAGGAIAGGQPAFFTRDGEASIQGQLIVDSADISDIAENDIFETVAFHEMLHALGFGAYYNANSEFASNITTNENGDDVYRSALSDALLSDVETYQGGIVLSPDNAHWSDVVYGAEIMTTTISTSTTPYVGIETLIYLEDDGYDTVIDNPLKDNDLFRIPPTASTQIVI